MNALSEQFQPLSDKVEKVSKSQTGLESRCATLEAEHEILIGEIERLKNVNSSNCSEILAELEDRRRRENNILILGCQENAASEPTALAQREKSIVINLLKQIVPEVTADDITRLIRLGKKEPNKIRPIKVTLSSGNLGKTILRQARTKLPAGLKVVSDQTLGQKLELDQLRRELQRRKQTDPSLTIRYVNGVPKIVRTDRTPASTQGN